MKKILLTAIAAIATLTASAQFYAGGTLGLERNASKNITDLTIAPEVGYHLNDTWAVGAGLGYTYRYDDGRKTNVFDISPYARYTYFRTDNNLVNLFVDGGVKLGIGKTKYEHNDGHTVALYSIGFTPGVALNLTDKFSIVTKLGFLGYNGCNDAAEDAGYDETFGFRFSSMDLQIGFYVNF